MNRRHPLTRFRWKLSGANGSRSKSRFKLCQALFGDGVGRRAKLSAVWARKPRSYVPGFPGLALAYRVPQDHDKMETKHQQKGIKQHLGGDTSLIVEPVATPPPLQPDPTPSSILQSLDQNAARHMARQIHSAPAPGGLGPSAPAPAPRLGRFHHPAGDNTARASSAPIPGPMERWSCLFCFRTA